MAEAKAKKPFHEIVAENLIAQLKEGTAPWQKPWNPGAPGAALPMNPTTGKRYKGINAIHLMAQGYSDQRWMTYKQATAAGAQVRKGEKVRMSNTGNSLRNVSSATMMVALCSIKMISR